MIYNVTHEFSRPADTTAYAANDLVANSTVAANVVIPNWGLSHIRGGVRIIGARLVKSGPVVTNAQFRLFLFGSDPSPLTNGDNASVFYETSGKDYVDTIDFNLTGAFQHALTWSGVRTPVSHQGIGFRRRLAPTRSCTVCCSQWPRIRL